jgi:predicted Zn finger-like uncharacterized protein
MALATKCPQCGALFRVVADQLKLRGGLVRCGQCRGVFDAIGSLTYVDDTALAQSRTASGLTRQPTSGAPDKGEIQAASAARDAVGPATTLRIAPSAPATLAGSLVGRPDLLQTPGPEDPAALRRRVKAAARARRKVAGESLEADAEAPTLSSAEFQGGPATAPLDDGVEAGQLAAPPEEHAQADAVPESAPSFTRLKRRTPQGFSIVFGGGSALLVVLAAIQLTVVFRADVLAHWPQARSALVDLCSVFRCTVNWPTQADQLAVIASELQAIPGTDALELTAVVRNRASFRQSLPALEVTLTDARNRALARKVFAPADYLASAGEASSRIDEGFAAGGDLTIRLFFEARGLQPAGFLVYPFFL